MRPYATIAAVLIGGMLLCPTGSRSSNRGAEKSQAASVHGQVILQGTAPQNTVITVPRDSVYCGATLPEESLLIDSRSHGIASVVVSLEGVQGQPLSVEAPHPELESRACRFFSRVSATTVGTMLEIRNTDPILHNIHVRKGTRIGKTVINIAQPPGGKIIRKPILEAGMLDVRCDAHPFMRASVHVFPHPYFAVTDATGHFTLPPVPPGTYRLRIWQEDLGIREQTLTVPSHEPVVVKLKFDKE